jgi:hypothetical protein
MWVGRVEVERENCEPLIGSCGGLSSEVSREYNR